MASLCHYFPMLWWHWTVFCKIVPGSFGIAPGSCQIPVNQAQIWNENCSWFPLAYFKAWQREACDSNTEQVLLLYDSHRSMLIHSKTQLLQSEVWLLYFKVLDIQIIYRFVSTFNMNVKTICCEVIGHSTFTQNMWTIYWRSWLFVYNWKVYKIQHCQILLCYKYAKL